MRKVLPVAISSVLLAFATHAAAESLRCTGDVTWGGMDTKVHIDIGLPGKIDEVASMPFNSARRRKPRRRVPRWGQLGVPPMSR